jgi:hypothetical protein
MGLHGPIFGRSVLDLDESLLDDYMELCQRGLLRPDILRSGRNGRTGPDEGRWLIQSGQISELWKNFFLLNRAEFVLVEEKRGLNGRRVINVR